jgi:hypothetical protein
MKWDPANGHVPRGFCGGIGDLEEVELVLVFAEPGVPHELERHAPSGTPLEQISSAAEYAYNCFQNGKDQFHRNVRGVIDSCYPKMTFEEQMRRVWITDSVLCSAPLEGGSVKSAVAKQCRLLYLERQLRLFPKALVVALGSKAAQRLRGIQGVLNVGAAAPPGCNQSSVRASWDQIPQRLSDLRSRRLES